MRQYYIYILSSRSRRLYVGVTSDLQRRIYQHRAGDCHFTSRYHINRLVYFETTGNVVAAISREKEIKGWVRKRKVALVDTTNPQWTDLAADWFVDERARTADPSSLRSSG